MFANALWVMSGTALLGLASGVLGVFALLRRRALMGDVLAHAALPGIVLAYMVTSAKAAGPLLVGAAATGVLGVLAMLAITRHSRLKEDSAMSLVLTVFFGLGIMLLGVVQRMPGGNQSGLDKYLFGQAAAIVPSDVRLITLIAALLCLMALLFYKEFKLLAFDPGFGAGLGFPMTALDLLLNLGIVVAVVIGLEAVGVVLMAALLTTPAVTARYWTNRLSVMLPLAGLFGALSGVAGTLASQVGPRMPTGPLIVLAASLFFFVSLLAAPQRGLLACLVRFLRTRARTRRSRLLEALYDLAEEAACPQTLAAASPEALSRRTGVPVGAVRRHLARLSREGLVDRVPAPAGLAGADAWKLTAAGVAEAYPLVREERLHLVCRMHEADLDGVQWDAGGRLVAAPETLRQLEALLVQHGMQPRLHPGDGA